jgi:uncharacterized membrane protein
MNIHPIFVHFPIALLTLYALLEIFPLGRWFPRAPWDTIKTFLVVLGTLGALAAIATGSLAEDLITDRSLRPVLHLHETFAYITLALFGLLAAAYVIRFIFRNYPNVKARFPAGSLIQNASDFILQGWVRVPLALLGMIAITVTGALGGTVVYGPGVDPVAAFVYSLFFH